MRRVLGIHRPAVLATLALALSGTACNHVGNQSQNAEAVILVTNVTTADTSVASTVDTTAILTLSVLDRNTNRPLDDLPNFFNDVTLTNYSVVYQPAGVVPDIVSGVISTGFLAVGSSGASLTLTMVANGSKPAAGTVVLGDVHVEGHDLNGRVVTFDAQVAITFTP